MARKSRLFVGTALGMLLLAAPLLSLAGGALAQGNSAPTAVEDNSVTDEDAPVTVAVLSNDSDADGDPLTVASLTSPANGSAVVNADQSVTYTPAANFNGSDAFSYTVSDGNGNTASATVTVTVNPVNDPPIAADDSATTDEGVSTTIAVLSNDNDVDGGALTVDSITAPSNGSAVVNADGTVTYTSNLGFVGVDSFSYSISDGSGGGASAVVTVTVNAVNSAPIAVDDSATTKAGVPVTIAVLGNDSDPDGDALSVLSVSLPANGSAVLNPDQTVTYTPNVGFEGSDSFSYTITDGTANTLGAVFVQVNGTADQFVIAYGDTVSDGVPSAGAGNIETPGATDSYQFQGNAGDQAILDVLSGSNVQFWWRLDAPDGSQVYDGIYVDRQLTLPQSGTYMLTVRGFNPSTSTGVYSFRLLLSPAPQEFAIAVGGTVSDGVPASGAGNLEAPGAVDLYRFNAAAGQEIIFDALVGDTGQFWRRLEAPDGSVVFDSFYVDQQVTLSQTGTYTLTLRGYTVTSFGPYSFRIQPVATTQEFGIALGDTVSDGVPAPGAGNLEAPGAVDVYRFDAAGQGLILDALTGDTGTFRWLLTAPDGTVLLDTFLMDQQVALPQTGTYRLTTSGTTVTSYGIYSFQLVAAPPTPQEFIITLGDVISDGVPAAGAGNIEAPGAVDRYRFDGNAGQTVLLDAQGGASGPFLWSLAAPDGTIVFETIFVDQTVTLPQTGTYVLRVSGLQPTDFGVYSFALLPVVSNSDPVAVDDDATTDEDTPITIDVLANDSDADGDALVVDSVGLPANGNVVLNPDGTLTYTPAADFHGTDPFTYTVADGNGGSASAAVSVLVNAVNDYPIALDDSATTDEDVAVTIDVLVNDGDLDGDTLAVDSLTPPANGTVVLNADQTIHYTPSADFFGTDGFNYTVVDGSGGTASASVSIIVNAVNDPPAAVGDSATTDEGEAVTIDVLTNDSDVEGDALVVVSVGLPNDGAAAANPDHTVTYTPAAGFSGTDTFSYEISDGSGGSASAIVTVTIVAVNSPPLAVDDARATEEDTPVTIDVLSNDEDEDGDALMVESLTPPANGIAVLNADATVTYTPAPDFHGTDSFTYTISDGNGAIASATVTIAVTHVNDPPLAEDDAAATDEGRPVTIEVLGNDGDVEGDTLVLDSVTQPINGTATPNADNTVTYTPAAGFAGQDRFTYTVSDRNGGSASATVTIEVRASGAITVEIDVLPFIRPNLINLNSRSVLPTAVFGNPNFDARSIVVDSVRLAGAPTVAPYPGWPTSLLLDLNFDGHRDLLVYFPIQGLTVTSADTQVILTGQTALGDAFNGTDQVRIVPLMAPALAAPSEGAVRSTDRPTLRWFPVALDTCYHIQIDDAPFTTDEQAALQEATVVMLTSYRTRSLPDGFYYWRVRIGGDCELRSGPWSLTRRFTIEAAE